MEKQIETLKQAFADPFWRLNNLYRIIDEQGAEVLFRMRPAQEMFYREMWFFNIILKARQLGFTTLIDLIGLDMTIFTPNFTAVIIAETKDKAKDIFERKIKYPYEHLSPEIKAWCPVTSCSKGEMTFANGSSIKVMVSARSGTCNFLHVSEYGPVCAKSPAKAEEIKTGSFPSVHAGGFVFVESTAMGNAGNFYEMVKIAEALKLRGRILSPQEFKLHFFPWHQNPEYVSDSEIVISERLLRYFDELYDNFGIALSEAQQCWYAVQESIYHEKMWSEYPSYPQEAFKVAQEGAYYARQFEKIYRENRITTVSYEPALPVYTAWDLGISDDTAIWFFQFFGKEIRVIDYYENSGEGLPHYAAVVNTREYRYGKHFAPHDIAVRELGSGLSRLETARKLGLVFERILTNKDLPGGIEHCREMLQYCWFDDSKTEAGRKALENYKKEWNEKHSCYQSYPLHDWTSHGADAFRTMAMAWKMGRVTGISSGGSAPGSGIRVIGGRTKI